MQTPIYSLQILRFIAALLVVLHHLSQQYQADVFPFGGFGVDLFFVISGFVIALTSNHVTPRQFLVDRAARIVPLYWVLTIALVVAALLAPGLLKTTTATPIDIVQSLLFIPYARETGAIQPILFLGWTLNYEVFFYGLFAVALLFGRWRYLLILALLAALATIGYTTQTDIVPLVVWTNGIILEFGFGIVLYLAWQAGHIRRLGPWPALVGITLVTIAAVQNLNLPRELTFGIPAALIVAGALNIAIPNRGLWAPVILLGNASYSIYLIHPYVIQAIDLATRPITTNAPALQIAIAVLSIAAICAISVATYLTVERPTQRWLKALAGRSNSALVKPTRV
ncbi:acyltransferase [Devosia sp. 2618]|uniref:acyltransferase family protein n=1 Tax=Devosia sp. 2618 TaxID=3156454 RepID=UPI003391B878